VVRVLSACDTLTWAVIFTLQAVHCLVASYVVNFCILVDTSVRVYKEYD